MAELLEYARHGFDGEEADYADVYTAQGPVSCQPVVHKIGILTPTGYARLVGQMKRHNFEEAPNAEDLKKVKNRTSLYVIYRSWLSQDPIGLAVRQGGKTFRPAEMDNDRPPDAEICGAELSTIWVHVAKATFTGPGSLPAKGEASLIVRRGAKDETFPINFDDLN